MEILYNFIVDNCRQYDNIFSQYILVVASVTARIGDRLGLRNPRMTGFGISNRDTFRTACEWSSGAIVGSRFVTLLDEHEGNAEEAVLALKHDLGLS